MANSRARAADDAHSGQPVLFELLAAASGAAADNDGGCVIA